METLIAKESTVPRNLRILIADDNEAIHDDFRKILTPADATRQKLAAAEQALFGEDIAAPSRLEFELDSAYQGKDALKMVQEASEQGRPYAMAFVDIRMPPGWDGVETVKEILAVDPRVQIVFCTAYSDYSWEEIFQKIGRHDGVVILKKPFDTAEAAQLAHAMTEKWRLHRESERKVEELESRIQARALELRRTEALYRRAIRGAGAIPYALDQASRKYIFIGEGIEDLIGYSAEEVSTELWDKILVESVMLGDAIGLSKEEAAERVKNGEMATWRCDMRVITRCGDSKWLCDSSVFDYNEEGKLVRCLGILQDMTERRTLEQQFLRAQRMESIGTLAGGIAHDLNNILAPIMMAVGLLKRSEEDEMRAGLLSTIESSAQRGAAMINQVLTFARGAEGDRQSVQVSQLLREILKIANDTFLKHIEVRSEVAPRLWTVSGDFTQLHQVLLNLSVNARDAMPRGGTLTLSAKNLHLDQVSARKFPDAKAGPYVMISLRDTGEGIAAENLDRLFEPFFTTKAPNKGTGLGLPTSLSIVKSHGGFFEVISAPNKGTDFRVYLPAIPAAQEEAGAPNERDLPPAGNGETILFVDDEMQVREMARAVLEASSYKVLLAADGEEGLTVFRKHRTEIAAVFTDMMMPQMDGHDLIKAIREIDPEVRIVAASGVYFGAEENGSSLPGSGSFIPKPYSPETMLNALKKVLTG